MKVRLHAFQILYVCVSVCINRKAVDCMRDAHACVQWWSVPKACNLTAKVEACNSKWKSKKEWNEWKHTVDGIPGSIHNRNGCYLK